MNESPADDAAASSVAPGRNIRVRTGSRLHFGLLDTAAPFGGVGVMIEEPSTEILVQPESSFCCDDPAAPRVRAIAQRVADQSGRKELPACRVTILARPPAHSGLGSGTQLAMAVAEAICRFVDHPFENSELARKIAGRGERSVVGIHGYFCGGMVYESAAGRESLNPIQARVLLPDDWRVAVFQPTQSAATVSGDAERERFSQLAAASAAQRRQLQSLIENSLVPAARQGDYASFVSALAQYNHQSGLLFAPVQGGPYNGPAVANLIATLVDRGAQGVGQSSWGNSVFAWFPSAATARALVDDLPPDLATGTVTQPRNLGRLLQP